MEWNLEVLMLARRKAISLATMGWFVERHQVLRDGRPLLGFKMERLAPCDL